MARREQSCCCYCHLQLRRIPKLEFQAIPSVKPGPNDSSCVSLTESSAARDSSESRRNQQPRSTCCQSDPDETQAGCTRDVKRDKWDQTTARRARKWAVRFLPRRAISRSPTWAKGCVCVHNYLKTNRLEASHKSRRGEREARRSPFPLAIVGVCLKRYLRLADALTPSAMGMRPEKLRES